ncbi:hypothetical protein [Corallococcus exiguus]|uniref:hypothetical protein n=1 Tax=Corallococcus exiguus TaxID=83462 RepID=UPI0015615391|nr:hypothetical protein [Corallococcus exiguus]NRD49811.1 hypothetical protein [Corallococcus exiguus]
MTELRKLPPESVLLVTLDSLRYDTAVRATCSSLSPLGLPIRAMAPAHFTFASHAAMWVGTTPGVPGLKQPFLDPKWGRLFRLVNGKVRATPRDGFLLPGRSIIDGFGQLGYRTVGTGAVDWFDPGTPTGAWLCQDFQRFFYPRVPSALGSQLAWLSKELTTGDAPAFCFLNAGETHVPYWHEGASWSPGENPCVPYGQTNSRALCESRQRSCLEFIDARLAPLLDAFSEATILVTADHGDCWGEDGLWEHGTWHAKTMEVPLWLQVRGQRVTGPEVAP